MKTPEEVARKISENLATMSPSRVFVYLREVLSEDRSHYDKLVKAAEDCFKSLTAENLACLSAALERVRGKV